MSTGQLTEDLKESADELKYFRVIPIDGGGSGGADKIFFDSREQYFEWRHKTMRDGDSPLTRIGVYSIPGVNANRNHGRRAPPPQPNQAPTPSPETAAVQ